MTFYEVSEFSKLHGFKIGWKLHFWSRDRKTVSKKWSNFWRAFALKGIAGTSRAQPWASGVHILWFWPSRGTPGRVMNSRNFRKSTVLKLAENDTFGHVTFWICTVFTTCFQMSRGLLVTWFFAAFLDSLFSSGHVTCAPCWPYVFRHHVT